MNPIPDRARELLRAIRPADDADESASDRRDERNDAAGVSRRRFLGATTALGVGSVAPGAATARGRSQGRYRIVLNSPSTPAEYQFAVTGDVERTTNTGGVSSASATIDSEDAIFYPDGFDGAAVRGATQGGLDAYVYTGQIVNFEAANCGSLNVWVDGSKQPACRLNQNYNMDVFGGGGGGGGSGSDDTGGGGRYHLVLHNPSSVSQYEITVSRDAWQTADAGSVTARSASIDAADRIDNPRGSEGRILRGSTSGEIDAYVYQGQIVEFDASNCGSLDVWVNGEYQPACALNREY